MAENETGEKFFANVEEIEPTIGGKPFKSYTYNDFKWFSWNEGEERASLDGHFTAEELIGIARGMLLRGAKSTGNTDG